MSHGNSYESDSELQRFPIRSGRRLCRPSLRLFPISASAHGVTLKDMTENHQPDLRSSFPQRGANADASTLVTLDTTHDVDLHARPTPNCPEASLNGAPPHAKAPLAPSSEFASRPAGAEDVRREIEQAYDGLHRMQAMLMYLRIMNRAKPDTGHYLADEQHAYVRALCRYEDRDFKSAQEFAAASIGIVRAVEILVSNCILEASSLAKVG